ncbi:MULTISPECIES: MarC family protein [Brucella/Ochrobactrum group]|uniref:UPF0056 membrane protein n=2 Tax=Brucella/Ochrobactrum group TaxID=2826938 RepID=A0ABU1MFF9_9HYPH|nr:MULTISPECIES: MarC family protein [Brucella/Ochrobactrum group]MCX2699425.1 MarC family protein [Ochrobactrum chromiisoli]MDR6434741.1 multiple antibiotic resistance protein [Brucella pseudogrignonensis]
MEWTFIHTLTFTFMSVFSMVNPIGMAPVFLAQTSRQPKDERHKLAYRVATYGALMLIITLFVGPKLLQFFGVTLPDIQVAGGIFVFFTAWQMLVADPAPPSGVSETPTGRDKSADIAFFPLTMPITAGAGTIAIILTLSSKMAGSFHDEIASYAGAVCGIMLVFICVAICYRYSDVIFKKIGVAGTAVLTRLTAFLLLAIGVSVTWGGLSSLILSLK